MNIQKITEFVEHKEGVNEFVTKIGGQPNWLEEPQWPVLNDEPMQFMGQVKINDIFESEDNPKMAYLFLADGVINPDADDFGNGESAVIIQPGGSYDGETINQKTGPLLQDKMSGRAMDSEYLPKYESGIEDEDDEDSWLENKLGGFAFFDSDTEAPEGMKLLLQILPYGAFDKYNWCATLYVFVNEEYDEGELLWIIE
jgi:uncharacterized protein YwqG